MVEKALKKAKLVIVQDISNNSITADYADVILPAAGWLEKDGTMTNSDRRISRITSYNVCYTKLLRIGNSQRHAGFH